MKKAGKIFKTVLKTVSAFLILILIGWGIVTLKIRHEILNSPPAESELATDTIQLHFIHGSVAEEGCLHNKKTLGGYLGGHVEIQLDDGVYGFTQQDKKLLHYFPRFSELNADFEFHSEKDWQGKYQYDKITSVLIPITQEQKQSLLMAFQEYLPKAPYDYAFLGHRCTSSAGELLSRSSIFGSYSQLESIVAFFYPRRLRFLALDYAEKYDLEVLRQEGIACRSWE